MSTTSSNAPLAPSQAPDEGSLDLALRPTTFDDYIGQAKIKQNLMVLLQAAKMRNQPPEHMLLHGPSGLGKTTLAYLIARELDSSVKITSGTALEKAGDVGSILTGLSNGDVLFIDEVHRLNKSVEEVIYPAMENFKLDIIIGKGNAAKTLQIDLPHFTLVAATTKISQLSTPFRSRFGANFRLDYYRDEEILDILKRSADLLGVTVEQDALAMLARSARQTPRIANRLLKRVRDYAQVNGVSSIDVATTTSALQMMEIDERGLEETDRRILRIIGEKFGGGPVGIKSLAAALSEEESTVEDVYEPYLLQISFIDRTPKGRVITDLGREHIGLAPSRRSLDF